NFYGAPIPPWERGYHPGWYYGDHFDVAKRFGFGFLFPYLKDHIVCNLFDFIPSIFHCPRFKYQPFHPKPLPPHFPHGIPAPPPHGDGWVQTFGGLGVAVQAGNYLTYGLVDTIDDCKVVCSYVEGCVFFNAYHDVFGHDGSPLLTCALFSGIHGPEACVNKGGLGELDGNSNVITDSVGY
ncbi:hypothetical protein K435DRAFT_568257, partial [Dendrothele bispora CBS 962.96]